MLLTEAMRGLVAEAVPPRLDAMSDEAIVADFRERCGTVYHPVGTCRMGSDPATSALDPALRVRGVDGLRVCDLSAMPDINAGNTAAPAMMLGSRCAAFVLDGT
jgi:choline dehydrogenase